jgi:5'-deoxynucleotidase YfbR-like HD superfamily hydrolase
MTYDVFDNNARAIIDPESLNGMDFSPLTTPEEDDAIFKFFNSHPNLKSNVCYGFDPNDAWIQTYSGRRFTPTNPVIDAIVIQDIAHSLSMQCRFSGHVKRFYSVAQHSVLVSYICDMQDALWGLLHDGSEAYLVDVPSPLKRSGKFDSYLEYEKAVQGAICKRFGLLEQEPLSVSKADKMLLATEARDLMSPLRSDWVQPIEPLPFTINPLGPQDAKNLFMKRFFELTGCEPSAYQHYLSCEQ